MKLDLNFIKPLVFDLIHKDTREYAFTFFMEEKGKEKERERENKEIKTEIYIGSRVTQSKEHVDDLFQIQPFFNLISAHTHPIFNPNQIMTTSLSSSSSSSSSSSLSLYYFPPSMEDYYYFIKSYFRLNTRLNLVFAREGTYVVTLKQDLISFIKKTFPEQIKNYTRPESRKLFKYSSEIPAFTAFLENYKKITNNLHINLLQGKITLNNYLHEIRNLGFHIDLIPWSEPFVFQVSLSSLKKSEWQEIKDWMSARKKGDLSSYLFLEKRDRDSFLRSCYFDLKKSISTEKKRENLIKKLFNQKGGTIFNF